MVSRLVHEVLSPAEHVREVSALVVTSCPRLGGYLCQPVSVVLNSLSAAGESSVSRLVVHALPCSRLAVTLSSSFTQRPTLRLPCNITVSWRVPEEIVVRAVALFYAADPPSADAAYDALWPRGGAPVSRETFALGLRSLLRESGAALGGLPRSQSANPAAGPLAHKSAEDGDEVTLDPEIEEYPLPPDLADCPAGIAEAREIVLEKMREQASAAGSTSEEGTPDTDSAQAIARLASGYAALVAQQIKLSDHGLVRTLKKYALRRQVVLDQLADEDGRSEAREQSQPQRPPFQVVLPGSTYQS